MNTNDTDNTMQHLHIELIPPPKARLNQAIGSLLHGFIMEQIDTDYADFLHSQATRPYSQYIIFDAKKNLLHWHISALNTQASHELLQPLFNVEKIFLRRKNMTLTVNKRHLDEKIEYQQLIQKYFTKDNEDNDNNNNTIFPVDTVKYTFLTSTGFRSNGENLIFPAPNFIFNSLLRRFNTFFPIESFCQKGFSLTLMQEVHIADYNIHYFPFSVEGRKIPAFKGYYTLKISQNDMARRIIAMLSEYATYANIGTKTALGMGATKVELF